jgi:glycosyltransferase involved in cell wall biosynthesis
VVIMTPQEERRIVIGFREDRAAAGGARVNSLCAGTLRSSFPIVDDPARADLQVRSFDWRPAGSPACLFIDHGSFADAGFWAFTATGLRARDTILVSSAVCERVAARFFAADGPLVLTVPFSVDLDLFRPAGDRPALRAELAARHAIPAGAPWLLVVSGFVRRKNHHLAVHFLHALLEEVPDAHLLIAGGTPAHPSSTAYRAAVEELAGRMSVGARVRFPGHLDHERLAGLMAASDLLLHFSNCRLENFGLVVAEAMAAGLPVVAADWGGLRDLVRPGTTGILAPTSLSAQGPRTDWRSAVGPAAALLRDGAAWTRASNRARAAAEETLGDGAFGERFERAVESALQRGRTSAARPVLTPGGTELVLRTLALNALHPEIKDAGDEYRLLMTKDGGQHYRFLTGPAATLEYRPRISGEDRLYPVVTWEEEDGGLRITDPAWPGRVRTDATGIALVKAGDGRKRLDDILDTMGPPAAQREAALRTAQDLVDEGLLCPLASI